MTTVFAVHLSAS